MSLSGLVDTTGTEGKENLIVSGEESLLDCFVVSAGEECLSCLEVVTGDCINCSVEGLILGVIYVVDLAENLLCLVRLTVYAVVYVVPFSALYCTDIVAESVMVCGVPKVKAAVPILTPI